MVKSRFDDKKWEPMGGMVDNIWDYRELGKGAEFVGVFKQTRTIPGKKGDIRLHIFDDDKGVEWGVWGNALLDARFSTCFEGQEVGIKYLGKEHAEKSGNDYHNFEVFKAKIEELESEEVVNVDEINLD